MSDEPVPSSAALKLEAPSLVADPSEHRIGRERRDSSIVLRISDDARRSLLELSRLLIGHMSLKDAQRALRTSMSQEALARCKGSRRAAATMLGVDRRYVQRLAHESDLADEEDLAHQAEESCDGS